MMLTILLGVVTMIFGIITAYLNMKNPSKRKKREALIKRWGQKTGLIMYLVAYIFLPIIFGAFFIYAGLNGVSVF